MKDEVIVNPNAKNKNVGILCFSIAIVFGSIALIVSRWSIVVSILVVLLAIWFIGFSDAYLIRKDFDNKKLYLFFGMVLWKRDLQLEFPEYISVFHASFVQKDEFDEPSEKYKEWVIRFFNKTRHSTVLQHYDYNVVLEKANELGLLLDIPVYDTSKSD